MVKALNKDSIACIRSLKENCKDYIDANRTLIEKLFYLLLSQIDISCTWQGKHSHELNVSTRLLAELSVAKLYNVSPSFQKSDTLIGKYVLPVPQKELGFNVQDNAKEHANSIAYAIYKKWGNEGLTQQALKDNHAGYQGVNEDLKLLREDDEAVYRFEINTQSEEAKGHALLEADVRDYIHKHLLPDLPIVLYGGLGVSVKNEERLQTHVRAFVKRIVMS